MKKYFIVLVFILGANRMQAQEPVNRNKNQATTVSQSTLKAYELSLLKSEITLLFSKYKENVNALNVLSAQVTQKINEYKKKKGVLSFNIEESFSTYTKAELAMSSQAKKLQDLMDELLNKL